MAPVHSFYRFCTVGAILFTLTSAGESPAQTVWSGLGSSFTKADYADVSLPANQDRITDNVWLTRDETGGIYNIHEESFFVFTSPADTEWATDLMVANTSETIAASNWANLTFDDWIDAYGGSGGQDLPARLTGHNAVLHLISDDIYLDIQFTAWTTGHEGGGGFSYLRAVAVPEPATAMLLVAGITCIGALARNRPRSAVPQRPGGLRPFSRKRSQ